MELNFATFLSIFNITWMIKMTNYGTNKLLLLWPNSTFSCSPGLHTYSWMHRAYLFNAYNELMDTALELITQSNHG